MHFPECLYIMQKENVILVEKIHKKDNHFGKRSVQAKRCRQGGGDRYSYAVCSNSVKLALSLL